MSYRMIMKGHREMTDGVFIVNGTAGDNPSGVWDSDYVTGKLSDVRRPRIGLKTSGLRGDWA